MRKLAVVLLALAVALPALAQKHELSLSVGAQVPVNATFNTSTGFGIEGSYAGRLAHVPLAALYVELPVAAGLKGSAGLPLVGSTNYSSLFVAPGLKLKLAPELPVSPWFAVGGGLAHFRIDATATTPQTTHNSAVADFAAGVDFKIFPYLSARGEVRDFWSGNPFKDFSSGLAGVSDRQHNIFPMVGLVVRF